MEPKPMDVEDQRRLEIAPTWASLLAQPGYLPSSYNKTIPFCSITKIIVLPIIYSHLSSDLKCVYLPLFIGVFQEWTIGVKPIVFAIHQIVHRLYVNARKY